MRGGAVGIGEKKTPARKAGAKCQANAFDEVVIACKNSRKRDSTFPLGRRFLRDHRRMFPLPAAPIDMALARLSASPSPLPSPPTWWLQATLRQKSSACFPSLPHEAIAHGRANFDAPQKFLVRRRIEVETVERVVGAGSFSAGKTARSAELGAAFANSSDERLAMSALPPKTDVDSANWFRFVIRAWRSTTSRCGFGVLIWRSKRLYTKALSPVIALPTIKVFISRVPS